MATQTAGAQCSTPHAWDLCREGAPGIGFGIDLMNISARSRRENDFCATEHAFLRGLDFVDGGNRDYNLAKLRDAGTIRVPAFKIARMLLSPDEGERLR